MAVEGMEFGGEAREVPRFIGLKMSDDGELNREMSERLMLLLRLLDLIFAKDADAGIISESEDMRWDGLADGQEPYLARIAPGSRAGGLDPGLNGAEVFSKERARIVAEASALFIAQLNTHPHNLLAQKRRMRECERRREMLARAANDAARRAQPPS